jgi:hypothetical protein
VGQACNDLLDNAEPSTSTAPENVLNDAASLESLRAGMYDDFHGFTFATRMFLGPDALADNSTLRDGATRFSGLNNNTDANATRTGLNDGSYGAVYDVILKANALINGVPEGVLDEETATQYEGEAKALRAFAMHYLVKVLGYEPGMSPDGFDLGIIIRTDYVANRDDVQELPRNTVSEVYTQIISDLEDAEQLLTTDVSQNYVSKSFAQAMLARVNLYAGNWSTADEWATEAISTSGLGLVTDSVEVADMFNETSYNHPEAILAIDTEPSTESLGTNDALNAYTANQWLAQLPTQSLVDLYENGDNRLGWFGPCSNEAGGGNESGCTAANDNGWEIKKWNAPQGQFADDYPLIRIAELKLIQAEARFQEAGIAAGMEPLNELREARGLSTLGMQDLALTDQQNNVNPGLEPFMAEVLSERRKELAFEGHRFFDLKRLGLNIPDPSGEIKISYDSYKILDDISPSELETNGELDQNPGYN